MADGEHELTEAEAALLLAATKVALGKAGAMGGSLGMPFGNLGAERAGAAGGRLGARLFTRARTATSVLEVALDVDVVRARVLREIAGRGSVVDDPNGARDGSIWGVVASGSYDMVPALVRVGFEHGASGGTRVHLRATGREGLLVNQRIAEKALDRLRAAIQGAGP